MLHPLGVKRFRQDGAAVLVPLAASDGEKVLLEIHVLDPQFEAFLKVQPAPISHPRHERVGGCHQGQDLADLLAGEDDRQPLRVTRANGVAHLAQVSFQCVPKEEKHRAEGLVRRRCGQAALDREVADELLNVLRAESGRILASRKDAEPSEPAKIRPFGAEAEVLHPQYARHLLGQSAPLSVGYMVGIGVRRTVGPAGLAALSK